MIWELPKDKGTYIFRYYLPCEPVYGAEVTAHRADELVRWCLENGIEAVMLYVDLNPHWYYMPDSLEHTRYYVDTVAALGEKLRQVGISYQLNYQNLFGSWDGGADLRSVNGWENFVDQNGIESWGVACSTGKKFRKTGGEKLHLWAETRPDVIWIDDDIRFHNHRANIRAVWEGNAPREQLDFGCFCDTHIALFNKKYGTAYTRQEITAGINTGNELRKMWMDFTGECANELTDWISRIVHTAFPDTKVAIMTSGPDTHAVEGRDWNGFLANLSGGKKPLLRPTFGPYSEAVPRDFTGSWASVQQLKANIAAQYGTDVDFCPEIENTRFTRWSKSIGGTGYQIMLSAFLGCKGVTLSIFDLEGCVLDEEPEFGELLREKRPFIDALAGFDLWNSKDEGIGLITAPDRIKETTCPVGNIRDLTNKRFWDRVLLQAGIPCKYVLPDGIAETGYVAADEYAVRLLTDEEVKTLLSGKVLLDAPTAKILEERGFGSFIGVSVGEKMACIAGKERFDVLKHADGSTVYAPSRMSGGGWNALSLCGAEALSHLVTPYGTEYPGFTRYRNQSGGTVFVYPTGGDIGDGFYTNHRIRMLKAIVSEMGTGRITLADNPAYALTAVKAYDEGMMIFFANLAPDSVGDVTFTLPKVAKSAELLDRFGNWHPAESNGETVTCKNAELPIYGALVCKITC